MVLTMIDFVLVVKEKSDEILLAFGNKCHIIRR